MANRIDHMQDIRDIKPPQPLGQGPGLVSALLAGLVLVLFGLAVWRYRRTAPNRQQIRTLLRALDRLEAEATGLDDRTFAYRLADLLRQALARRTGIAALAMTTEEILPRLNTLALSPSLGQAVADALRRADPARYAGDTFSGVPRGSAPWPPEASPLIPSPLPSPSSSPQPASLQPPSPAANARRVDLATVRALIRHQGRPWCP